MSETTGVADNTPIDPNMFRCPICGVITTHNEDGNTVVWVNGQAQEWCNDCWEHHSVDCACCGHDIPRSDVQTVDGYRFCNTCYNTRTFVCEHCGGRGRRLNNTTRTQVFTGDGYQIWCAHCRADVVACDNCYTLMTPGLSTAVNGVAFCPDCVQNHTVACSECGTHTRPIHVNWVRVNGNDIPMCHDCFRKRPVALHNYHGYKGPLKFYGTGRKAGFELECGKNTEDGMNAVCDELIQIDPKHERYHCEEDGSIPDWGFELVSMPHDMSEHIKYDWAKVLNIMESGGMKASSIDGVGLHVHVSRENIKHIDCAKIDIFMAHNQTFFTQVARRTSTRYAKPKEVLEQNNYWGESGDRYQAVNFCPDNTIEFRLWKSTLNHSKLLGYIELSIAIVEWAPKQPVMSLLCTKTLKSFREYLQKNCKYANALVVELVGEVKE